MAKTMVITGGSRGIGAATARAAAAAGWQICLTYQHDEAAAAETTSACRALGARAISIQADVSVEPSILSLFERVDGEYGGLDCLVNNAGTVHNQARLETFTWDRLQSVFTVNAIGTIVCAREAVRRMSTRHGGRGGSIVNVSSMAAVLGSPHEYIDYAATKGAIDTMTVGLAREVAAEGIRVNAVRPGLIATDIHSKGGEPGRVERLAPELPMRRGGTAEEVASVILFLASDASPYTTGALVDVAGGR